MPILREINSTGFVVENNMGKLMAEAAALPSLCVRRVDNRQLSVVVSDCYRGPAVRIMIGEPLQALLGQLRHVFWLPDGDSEMGRKLLWIEWLYSFEAQSGPILLGGRLAPRLEATTHGITVRPAQGVRAGQPGSFRPAQKQSQAASSVFSGNEPQRQDGWLCQRRSRARPRDRR